MAELAIGSVFAGHRIEDFVGKGGMGVVYRGTHLALDRAVALKLIAPDLAAEEGFRERFRRESQIAAAIDHPHVITVHHAGEEDGLLFITMRYVDGDDLRSVIEREGRLDPRRAVAIVRQTAEALDAAHARGLVHRDVKPGNILLARDGGSEHVYLTDFGLTKRETSAASLTHTGEIVGTLDYIAPEQIKGEPVDARTDVYALGCVLFHAVTGRVPYPTETYAAKVYAHLDEPPPEIASLVPGAPPGLDAVVRRALAKDPDDRYQSAGALGDAASAAIDVEDAATRERAVPPPAASPPGAKETRPGGRLRYALVIGALAAVAAVIGLLVGNGGSDGPEITADEVQSVLATYQVSLTYQDEAGLERILSPTFTRKLLADAPVGRAESLQNYRTAFEARGATPRYALSEVRVGSDDRARTTANYSFTGSPKARPGDYGANVFYFTERDGRVLIDRVETYPHVVALLPPTVKRSDYPLEVAVNATAERVTVARGSSTVDAPSDAITVPLNAAGRRTVHSDQAITIRMTLVYPDGTRQTVRPYEEKLAPGPRR